MKKIFLFISLQIAVFAVLAQKHEQINIQRPEPANPMKDKQNYQGYTIRLMPAMVNPQCMGSYGFVIIKENKPVMHRFQNLIPIFSRGIQNKEDAYKIAQWMIRQHKKTKNWQNTMPMHVMQGLKIGAYYSSK